MRENTNRLYIIRTIMMTRHYLGQISSVSARLSQLLSLLLLTRLHREMSSPPSASTYCFNSDGIAVGNADRLSASNTSSPSSRENETLSMLTFWCSVLLSVIFSVTSDCKTYSQLTPSSKQCSICQKKHWQSFQRPAGKSGGGILKGEAARLLPTS